MTTVFGLPAHALTEHSPILEAHEERAEWAIHFALGLLVVGIVQAVWGVRQ